MNSRWRIKLFGGLRAWEGDQVVTHFGTHKTALLLAYLAYYPHRAHSRETLKELLWPGDDPAVRSRGLQMELTRLRRQFEPPGVAPGSFLVAERAAVQLNSTLCVTDVAEFEDALEAARRVGSASERARCLAQAVECYQGELLPGYQEEWIRGERRWLAESFFRALGQLLEHLEREGDFERALQYAHRGVNADPLREEAQRDLIRLYAAMGQTPAALGQYRALERLLSEQSQATPDDTTRALAGEIERLAVLRASWRVHHQASSTCVEEQDERTVDPPEPSLTPREADRSPGTSKPALPATALSRAGEGVMEQRAAPGGPETGGEGENRLLTVLFADMSGSLERTAAMPPEEAATLLNGLLAAMVDVLLKYGGRIDRFLGDGVLALFGAPQAHEDDPERAIRAAIDIREGARRLGLEVTAGINTGEVYLGEVGSALYQEMTVVGPVVSLAARLQEQAEPGQILVGASTYLQSRRAFEFAPHSLSIKGLSRPIIAYTVEHALARPAKARGIEGLSAELVGRDEELAKLKAILAEVQRGRGQMVSLIGEAGVGKSRLVAALRQASGVGRWTLGVGAEDVRPPTPNAQRLTPLWLEGRCVELGLSAGYGLFVDLLRGYFAWGPDQDERTRGERLASSLRLLTARGELPARRMEDIGPLLGRLLSVRFGTDWDERRVDAGPEAIKHQTFLAVRDFLVALSRSQPVILVLEDLHWADSLSLDLIPLLMESLTSVPLLLLCVYRPEREHRCWHLGAIAQQTCPERYSEIHLRELTPEQSRRLLESLLQVEELPAPVKELILERSHGNPFFVEEMVRSLISSGVLYQEGKVWRARESGAGEARGETFAVPESIQSVILSRVDRLRPELKQVLQSAAVIGWLFPRRLLERTVGEEIHLERALWELEEQSLICRERAAPEEKYSFKHILTQETIYYNILQRHQAGFHQKVGEAIEALYPEELDEQIEELAYHYERSRAHEKAFEYLLKAGEKARQAYLNDEAVHYLQRALKRLDAGTAEPRDLERRGRVIHGLSLAYTALGRSEQSEALLEEQIERCRLGRYAEGEARGCYWLAGLLGKAVAVRAGSPKVSRVEALLQRAIELCVQHGLEDWVAKPRLSLSFHHWASRRNLPELERLLTAVCTDLDRLDRRDIQRALTLLLEVQIARGRWEEARATFTRALAYGGPILVTFFLFLAEWEERLEREGAREQFVALCREWQAEAREAGVHGLPDQWFLEEASPETLEGPPLLDLSFASTPLPSALVWVDPAGVGGLDLRPGQPFTLTPPLGPDLWPPNNLNAPRLMFTVDGDFAAEARVAIGEAGELFTGLLLWDSERDFIRLERRRSLNHGDGIQLEACAGGSFVHLGRGRFPAPAVWLRMERSGSRVRCLCSEDRKQWWTCGSATLPEGRPVQVGLTCVARTAGAAASFERFTVWKRGETGATPGEEPAGAPDGEE